MVVGEFVTDGLESGSEFAAPIVTCNNINVGNEDDRKLPVVDLDAEGVQLSGL